MRQLAAVQCLDILHLIFDLPDVKIVSKHLVFLAVPKRNTNFGSVIINEVAETPCFSSYLYHTTW